MTLEPQHREALITELNKAKEEYILGKDLNMLNATEDFRKWSDIKLFLLLKKIELIEESLINNEIDF